MHRHLNAISKYNNMALGWVLNLSDLEVPHLKTGAGTSLECQTVSDMSAVAILVLPLLCMLCVPLSSLLAKVSCS